MRMKTLNFDICSTIIIVDDFLSLIKGLRDCPLKKLKLLWDTWSVAIISITNVRNYIPDYCSFAESTFTLLQSVRSFRWRFFIEKMRTHSSIWFSRKRWFIRVLDAFFHPRRCFVYLLYIRSRYDCAWRKKI